MYSRIFSLQIRKQEAQRGEVTFPGAHSKLKQSWNTAQLYQLTMLQVTEILTVAWARGLFFPYTQKSRGTYRIHGLCICSSYQGPRPFLSSSSAIHYMWVSSSWYQDGCCTSRHSICVLGRKKTEGLKVFSIQDFVLFESHMASASSKEAWQLREFFTV